MWLTGQDWRSAVAATARRPRRRAEGSGTSPLGGIIAAAPDWRRHVRCRSCYNSGDSSQRMATEEERCAEAKKFRRIDDAFHKGDLDALRAAVDDPASCRTAACRTRSDRASSTRSITARWPSSARCSRSAPTRTLRRRWVSAAHRRAELHARGARCDQADGRRRHPSVAAVVRRGSESARHQRLHAAPHGRRRAQSARGPDSSRRRRRSRAAHADRRV